VPTTSYVPAPVTRPTPVSVPTPTPAADPVVGYGGKLAPPPAPQPEI